MIYWIQLGETSDSWNLHLCQQLAGLFLDANVLALFGELVVKMILASYSDCFLSFWGPQLSGWLISFLSEKS